MENENIKILKKKLKMNKMKKSRILLWLLVGIYCASCSTSADRLPGAVGNTGDVLVVMRDYLWNGASGDTIRHYLTEPVMGLPSLEPTFTLQQNDVLTTFLQRTRNILNINIDPGYEMATLRYHTDVNAKHQIIFYIDAPSADSAIAGFIRNKDLIIAGFLMKGRDAIIEDYKKSVDNSIVERLLEKYQVNILIPKPYTLDVEREEFVWISRIEGERQYGILMWNEPYTSTSQLEIDNLITKMNTMTRRNVPGAIAGSYMADEPTVTPEVKRYEKNGVYTVQLNGLWQMENGFMGGPYVSQTIVDIERGQLITAHGFVYYPNRNKRQMIRQLEAILHTMMPAE